MQFTIRKIEENDVEAVYSLLIELAIHEQIKEKLTLTPEKMRHDLFSTHADWYGFVVDNDEFGVIGFCLFTITNINRSYNKSPLIHIDDLYIKPAFRQYGLGKGLLNAIAQVAKDCEIDRLELWCLKDNTVGQSFYQKLGGQKLDFLDIYCLEAKSL